MLDGQSTKMAVSCYVNEDNSNGDVRWRRNWRQGNMQALTKVQSRVMSDRQSTKMAVSCYVNDDDNNGDVPQSITSATDLID